jgi:hypothetical protein
MASRSLRSRVAPQLIVFSYHKSGTSLFLHVMTKVSERLGLTLSNHYGLVGRLDVEPDVVLLPHSVLRCPLDRPYRAIRLIRDPRDIWVSGYLYHLRCDELWCRNTDLDPTPPIGWPKVDYSVAHWPEDWKRRYLERLSGRSYQQNLLGRSLAEGLEFELEGYTGCTLATMREWRLNGADALDVKLEDVMADFDGAMRRIFDHFGFTAEQSRAALEVARSEDVRRMDDAAIAERPQIYSRTISKWRDVLPAAQIARFEERHGDLIRELGYEPAGAVPRRLENQDVSTWPVDLRTRLAAAGDAAKQIGSRPAQRLDGSGYTPAVGMVTRDAGIRLSADGAAILPTAVSQGAYSFVVPPGRQRADRRRIRIESRFGIPVDPGAPDLSDTSRVGVRVSEIAIRSDAGEVVIAADDPRLTRGWHDAEHAGTTWWRWTDGSAEVPWTGVLGPAIVTVRCMTLPEYTIHDEELEH